MSVEVTMPQMGESIVEGTLTKWLKKKGDRVERDEPLFEISTDKVDTEIPAPVAGVLSEVLVEEGTDRILGAHLLGGEAGETINLFALAIRSGIRATDLKHTIFSYPTHSSDLPYMV